MTARPTRQSVVADVLRDRPRSPGLHGCAYAPANIALCKYWGKRDLELNLPNTSSLSISMGLHGTRTIISAADEDRIVLNGNALNLDDPFSTRLLNFLDLFRKPEDRFIIETTNSVPTAAGLASSASGFAAMVMALDDLYGWQLEPQTLSVFARLGSGSACRSVFDGFVQWNRGEAEDGMDSHAQRLSGAWPEFRIGMMIVSQAKKPISSTDAMNRTTATSILYEAWAKQVEQDLPALRAAIEARDFPSVGSVSERNALAMHATMLAACPPIMYWVPDTVKTIRRVQELRKDGVEVYVTMDAGPNVKLLFLEKDEDLLAGVFRDMVTCQPFDPAQAEAG